MWFLFTTGRVFCNRSGYHNLVKELQLGDRDYHSYYGIHDASTNFSFDVTEEDAILVSNSTREAWNEYFYTFGVTRFPHSVLSINASVNPSTRKWKIFNFLRGRLCLPLHLRWGYSRVCLFVPRLAFVLGSLVWTNLDLLQLGSSVTWVYPLAREL